ncbi:hypothetical protein AJ80_00740 [Polytolypa hystricis UAMH7299]|uniref:Uncharacterized protein n=1 Tax=Polytolypa hystricis (strain UAMH7299) TaxID=1447883 RepID=A0A2B7Z2N3_POLH7|nr:hypothetical protein AJ80_00740 [Polytolypa hystricis UAMH7299]
METTDLQKAKTSRGRRSYRTEEEGSEYYLAAYCPVNKSKTVPKNDSIERQNNPESPGREPPPDTVDRKPPDTVQSTCGALFCSPVRAVQPTNSYYQTSRDGVPIPHAMGLHRPQLEILRSAMHLPPITKATLRELDLDQIMNHVKLRADVNFDHDLYFRAVGGERAKKKLLLEKSYWDAIALEISVYACLAAKRFVCPSERQAVPLYGSFEPRLPAMLYTLRDVLETLVPERDRPCVLQTIDVSFLMQQIGRGVLNLAALSGWAASLLKMHCAPMRDKSADDMVEMIRIGCESQDSDTIVTGLKSLFALLEAMKLDVANHQIRAFRVMLIDDTIGFMQEYFSRRMKENSINVEYAETWYTQLWETPNTQTHPVISGFEPVAVFFRGLSSLLLNSEKPPSFPETFQFDAHRLWHLRACLQDLIGLDVCTRVFEEVLRRQSRHPDQLYPKARFSFRSRLMAMLEDDDSCCTEGIRWRDNFHLIALEIASASTNLYNNDHSILYPGDDVIREIERALNVFFDEEQSTRDYPGRIRQKIQRDLEQKTFELARLWVTMGPLEISGEQSATSSLPLPRTDPSYLDLDRIAKLLAHIGVLHWRVWAPLIYRRAIPGFIDAVVMC